MFHVSVRQSNKNGNNEERSRNMPSRGVYAEKIFRKGDTIEICPVIDLNKKESKICDNTILGNFLFDWKTTKHSAIILGYGMLYNHSYTPNALHRVNILKKVVVIQGSEKNFFGRRNFHKL